MKFEKLSTKEKKSRDSKFINIALRFTRTQYYRPCTHDFNRKPIVTVEIKT